MELEHEGENIVLAVPDAVLGRTSASEIHVSHPLVSRRHCRFEATPEGVFIEDIGSSNGTFLNGARLHERRPLRPGDVVQIGHDGPRFTLLFAMIDGREVGGTTHSDDQETILAGDPRAAGLRARVTVASAAAASAAAEPDDEEAPTRESGAAATRQVPQTTGSIPVATPIGSGGESMLGMTDVMPLPAPDPSTEPPTRLVAAPGEEPLTAAAPDDEATRPVARSDVERLAPPPEPPPATVPAVVPHRTPPRGRRGGVILGFVLGLLLMLVSGAFTPLGRALHGLAPWGQGAGAGTTGDTGDTGGSR